MTVSRNVSPLVLTTSYSLLDLCLNATLKFQGVTCQQIFVVSVVLANLVLEDFEERALKVWFTPEILEALGGWCVHICYYFILLLSIP